MSRHQAYRNYNYQNDIEEYDGDGHSDDEEELDPEDQARMTQGTEQVRQALGVAADKVTTEQIQETLWHYYYDVDKSVTYLVTKYVSPAPKQTKKAKGKGTSQGLGLPCHPPSDAEIRLTWMGKFHDLPWGHVPQSRQAMFLAPERRKGGLLGGSGAPPKVSKLQALAAARKKKAEEKKTAEKLGQTEEKLSGLRLGQKEARGKENDKPRAGWPSKRQKVSEPDEAGPSAQQNQEPRSVPAEEPDTTQEEEEVPAIEAAQPSAFAQTLLGSASTASPSASLQTFALPYAAFPSSVADAFSVPSPDDVILAAQSKAGKKTGGATTKSASDAKADTAAAAVTTGVKTLSVDDTPLPKSKNLDVLREFERAESKKSASFVVVGHVDAGKSTLMGRLLLELKVVDQRTVEKYRREAERIGKSSFALAWILDQRPEERARGVTIDIATNKFETDTTSFTILDAPGHRDFIPNMIAGASQADFAILVVDASTGAFEAGLKGQTREHSLLIRSMGVSRVIVAVNKLDTVDWSQERFDEIAQQVAGFLSATGFQQKNVAFVPVSGLHGDNLVRRSDAAAASWYTGPLLIEELERSEPTARAMEKPLRLTIAEVYRTPQSAVTVAGRVDAGSLQTGDALLVQPSGETAHVKSIERDGGEPADWAVAGQAVALHLAGVDPVHVRAGDVACDPARPVRCVDTFTMKVLAFDVVVPTQVDVHRGRLHAAGQIVELVALLDKSRGTVVKKRPKIVKPGEVARIVVKVGAKVPLEVGTRVVLRSGGETLAAGLLE